MVEKILNNRILIIVIHIAIGYIATFSFFPKMYGTLCIAIPVIVLFFTRNKNEEALLFSSYLIGAEVFCRMTDGFFLYETGKYGVILFLLLGLFLGEFKQRFSIQYVFYLLLLTFGIIFTQVPEGESIRTAIIFNLSGPVVLGISAIYFYKRPIEKKKLIDSFFFMLLPLISMIVYLYFRTPSIEEIIFGGTANFETSGGFGPNQVATAIGLGVFIIIVFILKKKAITGTRILDIILLFYFIYRGLLTFSRGGIIASLTAILCFSFFYMLYKKGTIQIFIKYVVLSIIILASVWVYTSNITGGMLDNRYAGKNASGVVKKDFTSGRANILDNQLRSFYANPLGIGVGRGKFNRQLNEDETVALSHNEIGRLIEEHGLIGLIILIGLLIIPLFNLWRANNYQKAFLISFYLFWFLTINHSAMRIAFPGFIYGLSLIWIINEDEEN